MVAYRSMAVLSVVALVCAVLGALLLTVMVFCARRRQLLRGIGSLLSGLLLFALATLAGAVSVGVQGYRALTAEEVAARVRTEPTGPQRFRATVELPDGRVGRYDVSGDQLYVDAHILKWKPIVNLLGLQTGYELDRVGGRYAGVADERQQPHTVFPLGPERRVDVFGFVRRHPRVLAPLVDATYGSGTFVGADRPGLFEVRVSTTGLLIRPLADSTPARH